MLVQTFDGGADCWDQRTVDDPRADAQELLAGEQPFQRLDGRARGLRIVEHRKEPLAAARRASPAPGCPPSGCDP
jgi:hypothetical protein